MSLHITYIIAIVLIILGMTVSKQNAIKEQNELCYQVIDSGQVLDEHYKNKNLSGSDQE